MINQIKTILRDALPQLCLPLCNHERWYISEQIIASYYCA